MAQHPIDCRLITAIITPFNTEHQVDFPALERLTQHLIDTGSDGILVNGSTGENPTVNTVEKLEILKTVKRVIGDQPVKLIAGAGTNDTRSTIDMSQECVRLGVDALLVVVPYYNKPSQKGMMAHFSAVAEDVHAPIIIYNIPGRSVVNMLPETMEWLAERHGNLVGVKQSNPDMDQVSDIMRRTPNGFRLWCGDDSLTLPMMALGAHGVFSVASHVIGQPIRAMVEAILRRDMDEALKLHLSQMDIFKELFFLPNPTVVKACLAQQGIIEGHLRLPLVPPEPEDLQKIERLMKIINCLQPYSAAASV